MFFSFFYITFAKHLSKKMKVEKMKKIFVIFMLAIFCSSALRTAAQTNKWRDIYTVKKKDTIYGIAKTYGISIDELKAANPEMKAEGYNLKKGDFVFIPYAKAVTPSPANTAQTTTPPADDLRNRTIRIGVMLPLHNQNGDGLRMIEYYRGMIMACDSLKRQGISTDIHAWNVPVDADIRQTLLEKEASKCDIIFGPLYTTQVKALANFCQTNNIKMVIPFSINGNDVATYKQIYQVYQSPEAQDETAVNVFLQRFQGYHPVFVDCNDSTSRKGTFTAALRKRLEEKKIKYNLTSLKTPDEDFLKAFSTKEPNIIILNTARSPELNSTYVRLNKITQVKPDLKLAFFGYTEWLMYAKVYKDYYHRYETYIPAVSWYNEQSARTKLFEHDFKTTFDADMQQALPRFAITGFDQTQFFVRGLHEHGRAFAGTRTESKYVPLQTPLNFRQVGTGGYQNTTFMLVHYKTGNGIETITY